MVCIIGKVERKKLSWHNTMRTRLLIVKLQHFVAYCDVYYNKWSM